MNHSTFRVAGLFSRWIMAWIEEEIRITWAFPEAPGGCFILCLSSLACMLSSFSPDSFRPYGLKPARLLSVGFSRQEYLEWVAMPSSRGSSRPRDWTWVSWISCIAGGFFTTEPLGKPHLCSQLRPNLQECIRKMHEGNDVGHVKVMQKSVSLHAPLSFNWGDLSLTNDEEEDVFEGRPRTVRSRICLGTWKVNS